MDNVKTYQEVQEKDELVDNIISNLMLYQRKYSQKRKQRRRNFRQRLKEEQQRLHLNANQPLIQGTQFLELLVSRYKRLDKARVIKLASETQSTKFDDKKRLENWIWNAPKRKFKSAPENYSFVFEGNDEVKLKGYNGPMVGAYLSDDDDIRDPDDIMIDYKEDAITFHEEDDYEESHTASSVSSDNSESEEELGRLLQDADKTVRNKQIHQERKAAMEKLEKEQASRKQTRRQQRRKRSDLDEDEEENGTERETQPSRKRQRKNQSSRDTSSRSTSSARNRSSAGSKPKLRSKSNRSKSENRKEASKTKQQKQQKQSNRRISNSTPSESPSYNNSDVSAPSSPLLASSSPPEAYPSTASNTNRNAPLTSTPTTPQHTPPSAVYPSPQLTPPASTPPTASTPTTSQPAPPHVPTPSPSSGMHKLLVTVDFTQEQQQQKYVLKSSANTLSHLISDIEAKVGRSLNPESLMMLDPDFEEWAKFSMEDLPSSAKIWAQSN